jgi:hypothetical protein
MRLSWTREEVDTRLQMIMKSIHQNCLEAAEKYGTPGNYVNGANIAGFRKVADSMMYLPLGVDTWCFVSFPQPPDMGKRLREPPARRGASSGPGNADSQDKLNRRSLAAGTSGRRAGLAASVGGDRCGSSIQTRLTRAPVLGRA